MPPSEVHARVVLNAAGAVRAPGAPSGICALSHTGCRQCCKWIDKQAAIFMIGSQLREVAQLPILQSIFSPAARRTILEQNGKFSAATVG
jgi:hypothetical protein